MSNMVCLKLAGCRSRASCGMGSSSSILGIGSRVLFCYSSVKGA